MKSPSGLLCSLHGLLRDNRKRCWGLPTWLPRRCLHLVASLGNKMDYSIGLRSPQSERDLSGNATTDGNEYETYVGNGKLQSGYGAWGYLLGIVVTRLLATSKWARKVSVVLWCAEVPAVLRAWNPFPPFSPCDAYIKLETSYFCPADHEQTDVKSKSSHASWHCNVPLEEMFTKYILSTKWRTSYADSTDCCQYSRI
jgi:hypothetical protein